MARVIVTGLITQHRSMGGVAWDYLNFVLGLDQLGHEVYYIEDSGEWPYLDAGPDDEAWIAYDVSPHVRYLAETFASFGLDDRWAYYFPIEGRWLGMPSGRREEVIRSADLLLNVSGTLDFPDKYRSVQRLVYIDTDPIFTQIALKQGADQLRQRAAPERLVFDDFTAAEAVLSDWSREEKLKRRVDLHDVHFTVGETLDAAMSDTGHLWRPIKHPIVLSQWRGAQAYRDVYTTVANWTSYKPIVYEGRSYGQKDVELGRFLDLPSAVAPVSLELALARVEHATWESDEQRGDPGSSAAPVEPAHESPQARLRRHGWRVVDGVQACGDFASYRSFLQSSKGEWSVAKQAYVAGCTGWFSGRSGCYLAAGRPVIVQDTGFSSILPTTEGILAFTTIEEAAESVKAVERDYERHARAASALATEYFDSDKILAAILAAC